MLKDSEQAKKSITSNASNINLWLMFVTQLLIQLQSNCVESSSRTDLYLMLSDGIDQESRIKTVPDFIRSCMAIIRFGRSNNAGQKSTI